MRASWSVAKELEVSNLSSPIRLSLPVVQPGNASNMTCRFWNGSSSNGYCNEDRDFWVSEILDVRFDEILRAPNLLYMYYNVFEKYYEINMGTCKYDES